MRKIFYYAAFVIRHIGVISIAHVISLQARSQEFSRAGQVFANQVTSFQQLIGTNLHAIYTKNSSKYTCNYTSMQFNDTENHQKYKRFCYKKKRYFLFLDYIKVKKIYFQERNFSGAQLYLCACSNMQNTGAQSQSVRPIETQLETLIFVSHYLNRLAAFILNVFPSKIFAMMLLQSEC